MDSDNLKGIIFIVGVVLVFIVIFKMAQSVDNTKGTERNSAAHIIDSLYENKGIVTHATYKELMQFVEKHK